MVLTPSAPGGWGFLFMVRYRPSPPLADRDSPHHDGFICIFICMKGMIFLFIMIFAGCVMSAQEKKDTCMVHLPASWSANAATPGSLIMITSNCPVSDIQCSVYNRWGEKVFEEKVDNGKQHISWDPSSLTSGVYVYIVKCNQHLEGAVLAKSYSNHITILTNKK